MPDECLEISDEIFGDWDMELDETLRPRKTVPQMTIEAEDDIFGMSEDEFDNWLAHCERNN